jgi:hypothetical protein
LIQAQLEEFPLQLEEDPPLEIEQGSELELLQEGEEERLQLHLTILPTTFRQPKSLVHPLLVHQEMQVLITHQEMEAAEIVVPQVDKSKTRKSGFVNP